jgi:hypothetical protein
MSRQSGKTFRVILRALQSASEGRAVIVTLDNSEEVKRVSAATLKVANSYLSSGFITKAGENRYMMGSGGTLTFCLHDEEADQARKSRKPPDVFSDPN